MWFERLDFRQRAQLAEWMDEPESYEQLGACLRDLAAVNRWTFAYRPTLEWLRQFAKASACPLRVVDVGCGGGDTLRHIERWAHAQKFPVELTGIDLNPWAIRYATAATPKGSGIRWLAGNACEFFQRGSADVILSSLMTHHLRDDEIVRFLQWMESTAVRGWFVNDLERAPVPYHLFRLLAAVARWHPFIRHDGPISIRRSFVQAEWESLLDRAGISGSQVGIYRRVPARLCVARVKRDG